MIRRPAGLLAAPLALAMLLAGCGGGSSTTTARTQPTSTPASSTPATTSGTASTPSVKAPANIPQAVEACKQAIRAQQNLPATAKSKLEAVCAKAASGDTAAVKKAAREVCEEVIARTSVPAGVSKDQALAACRK
jgi:hypothetical protein